MANRQKKLEKLVEYSQSMNIFPMTETGILQQAAAGEWNEFFLKYLSACWREILLECRAKGIQIADADDFLQDLVTQIMKEGRFGREAIAALDQVNPGHQIYGNLPARYLIYRDHVLSSALFRTYLKSVIRRVIAGGIRRNNRRQAPLLKDPAAINELWIERSVSWSLDRQWVSDCMAESAWKMHLQSKNSVTKGKKRWFSILFLSVVQNASHEEIAEKIGMERSTVSGQLRQARLQFIRLLQQITGITDLSEIKSFVASAPNALREAFVRVADEASDERSEKISIKNCQPRESEK